MNPRPLLLASSLLLGLASCSQGGEEFNSSSEVKLADENYHWGWFAGFRRYLDYPIPQPASSVILTDFGVLLFKSDGTYAPFIPGVNFPTDNPYDLKNTGQLTVLEKFSGQVSRRYPGWLDLDGDFYFYLDGTRDSVTPDKDRLFLFAGVREITGTATVQGVWRHYGLTLAFSPTTTTPHPDRIARASFGSFEFDATNAIVNSSWEDSSGAKPAATGKAVPDTKGIADLEVTQTGGIEPGKRIFRGGIGKYVAILWDETPSDGHVGVMAMVRQTATDLSKSKIVGTYALGNFAIFPEPSQAGTDVGIGTIEFKITGEFKIDMVGYGNAPFSYAGTWDVGTKGAITLQLNGTGFNQIWNGAISDDYRDLVFVDATNEANAAKHLGLFLGIRKD